MGSRRPRAPTVDRATGLSFPWTITISPEEQAALAWIRRATLGDAIVQMDPISRGRATWTLIPSFAERRMAGGLPISLLRTPEYERRARLVRQIFSASDARGAWELARNLRIAYVYVGGPEREAFGAALDTFDRHPEYFMPAFRNQEVRIYAVAR